MMSMFSFKCVLHYTLTLYTHIHGAWESLIPVSRSQPKSNILLALIHQSPIQSVESHITTMQRGDIVLIQWCMVLSAINGKCAIGNTVGITTHDTYIACIGSVTWSPAFACDRCSTSQKSRQTSLKIVLSGLQSGSVSCLFVVCGRHVHRPNQEQYLLEHHPCR